MEEPIVSSSSHQGHMLSVSQLRLVFFMILLQQQLDSLLQPYDTTHCSVAGVILFWMLESACVLAGFSQLTQPSERQPWAATPCNSLVLSFSGGFKVIMRMHTHVHTLKFSMIA